MLKSFNYLHAICTATLFLISVSFFLPLQAFAVTTIQWGNSNSNIASFGIADGGVNTNILVQFTVNDTDLANNGISDTIDVPINSTSDHAGIILRLNETGDSGTFTNTNLIFSNGTGLVDPLSSQIVGISKPILNADPNMIEFGNYDNGEILQIFSSSDNAGIFMNLTETGPNTGIFTNILNFTQGPSIDGHSIHANPGDIVSIVYFTNNDYENELIIPNPDPAFGVIAANYGEEVDVSYNGAIGKLFLTSGDAPGGGGGGLIRPGLVLDVLASIIGGSPYIVTPPSFGAGPFHYEDGLTLTFGDNDTQTFDASKYNQEVPKQVMVKDMPVSMKLKTFESYKKDGVIHMGLYMIPRGHDMITSNSIASIIWEKGKDTEVNDPNHILSEVSASSSTEDKFQYTQFSFTPTKSYDKMSFLVKAWNDHLYSTDTRFHDAIATPDQLFNLPEGVIRYESFADLSLALQNDGFSKPPILSHIHDSSSVFNSVPGKVYWIYDTRDHTVTLVLEDGSGKVVDMKLQRLVAEPVPEQQNYVLGDVIYSHHSLSRDNINELEDTKSAEAIKGLDLMTKFYGTNYLAQYNFLGR